MSTCSLGFPGCWVSLLLGWVAWGLVASAALYLTWNHAVKAVVNVRQAKFWQALLVVVTLSVFCVPRYFMHKGGHWGRGSHSCWFHHGKMGCKDCWEKYRDHSDESESTLELPDTQPSQ